MSKFYIRTSWNIPCYRGNDQEVIFCIPSDYLFAVEQFLHVNWLNDGSLKWWACHGSCNKQAEVMGKPLNSF